MTDLIFIGIATGFFGLAVAYTYGCERLARDARASGGKRD
jgi:hypothetical protein